MDVTCYSKVSQTVGKSHCWMSKGHQVQIRSKSKRFFKCDIDRNMWVAQMWGGLEPSLTSLLGLFKQNTKDRSWSIICSENAQRDCHDRHMEGTAPIWQMFYFFTAPTLCTKESMTFSTITDLNCCSLLPMKMYNRIHIIKMSILPRLLSLSVTTHWSASQAV